MYLSVWGVRVQAQWGACPREAVMVSPAWCSARQPDGHYSSIPRFGVSECPPPHSF